MLPVLADTGIESARQSAAHPGSLPQFIEREPVMLLVRLLLRRVEVVHLPLRVAVKQFVGQPGNGWPLHRRRSARFDHCRLHHDRRRTLIEDIRNREAHRRRRFRSGDQQIPQ